MNYSDIKKIVAESANMMPEVYDYYQGKINGHELMAEIIVNSPFTIEYHGVGFIQFLMNNLNHDFKIDNPDSYAGSNSFFHAYFDDQFYQEFENLTENQIYKLDNLLRIHHNSFESLMCQ